MISRIAVSCYRCFPHVDIVLSPSAVFAGANGTGKSTVLDIPCFLGDMLEHGITKATLGTLRPGQGPRAQRLRDLLYRGQGEQLSLHLEASLPQAIVDHFLSFIPARIREHPPTHLRYQLRLQVRDTEVIVLAEDLHLAPASTPPEMSPRDKDAAGWRSIISRDQHGPAQLRAEYRGHKLPAAEVAPDRLALAQVADSFFFPSATWFKKLLASGIARYAPECELLRTPRPPDPESGLRPDAGNLPWQVQRLHDEQPERFAEWVRVVQLALSNVRSLRATTRPDDLYTYLQVAYGYEDSDASEYTVNSSGLSDGTLRILAYSILPYLPELPPLLTVEQPEDGIHPQAIEVVLESLSALPETQVLLTTHSPLVVGRTPIEGLICLGRDDQGGAQAVSGSDHPRLREWRREVDLGMLFAAGVLS